MISPSEDTGVKGRGRNAIVGMTVRLVGERVREISRLEFFALDRPETVAEVKVEADGDEIECLLKEEVVTLDEQLRSQTEQMSADIEMARNEARIEARLEWERMAEERVAKERAAILKVSDDFRDERTRYFARVEAEVVKLALAIAARVLHRESKLDPL